MDTNNIIKANTDGNLSVNINSGVATSLVAPSSSTGGTMNLNTDDTTIGVVSNKVTGKYKATAPLNMSSSA